MHFSERFESLALFFQFKLKDSVVFYTVCTLWNGTCQDEQFGCSDHMFKETGLVAGEFFVIFWLAKQTRGMVDVFLVFVHVVLAAESAESLRVPHRVWQKGTAMIRWQQQHKRHISLFYNADVLTLLLSFSQASKHVLFNS